MNSSDDQLVAERTPEQQREHDFARMCFDWTPKDHDIPCPGTPAVFDAQGNIVKPGCRCYQHQPGAFVTEIRLHVAVTGIPSIVKCTGRLDCTCESCTGARELSIARQRQARKPQPWEPKPSRYTRMDSLAA
jgi:hypothetical protein